MKTKVFLFLLVCTFCSAQSYGQAQVNGIYYYLSGSEAAVTGSEDVEEVIIPEIITYNGGVYNITSIGNNAFSGCTKLTDILIPNSVTLIGDSAFLACRSLKEIVIPNGVTSIGEDAFRSCSSLTRITIPGSVTSINNVFVSCSRLTDIVVSDQNEYYTDVDGILFNKDKTTLVVFPSAKKVESYTIPDGVTSIGKSGFSGCSGLRSIIIPNSLTSIGEWAFSLCGRLEITIPNSVTSIGNDAFYWCSSLTSITIPENVSSIGYETFNFCFNLASVTIPAGVTSIGDYAFSGCVKLTEIRSGNSTPPSLGNNSFSGVNKTTCKLYVPKGSYEAYKLAWRFDNIIETDFTAIQSAMMDQVSVSSTSNGIHIETCEKIQVSVFNIAGQKVYQSVFDSNADINLPKGIYIVDINGQTVKIAVK